ncbi:hypothetical protein GCM10009595_19270 [Falsarthrobacter nasiphocae]
MTAGARLERLLVVVDSLREHCTWTREQTHASIAPYALEEAEEVQEAVRDLDAGEGTAGELAAELGDLLFQVVLHARISQDSPDPALRFTVDDVLDALTSKLVRRSPHVFAPDGALRPVDLPREEIERRWEEIKAEERAGGAHNIPSGLD